MIGTRIGRYEIVGEIGRGGMGIVYRAIQTSLNRTVAVKMLSHQMALSPEYLSRFQREAETLARLAHENIVHIYDIEEQGGAHFIVMEFVSGGSLADLLRREGRLDASRARDIALKVADGLGAAHRQGIIHRDIKPDNILFGLGGQPKLTDFGIAHMRDTKFKTQTGMFMGTPTYSSPEQARGSKVTAASDLYSLGIVLYQMLSGEVPFQAEDPLAVALKHLQEAPRPLGEAVAGLPEPFAALVHKLLEKEPEARFSDASALHEALSSLELGARPGTTLAATVTLGGGRSPGSCPECETPLQEELLTCPSCGRAVQRRCARCGQIYDPVSPECPFCRTPADLKTISPTPPSTDEVETILTPPQPTPAARVRAEAERPEEVTTQVAEAGEAALIGRSVAEATPSKKRQSFRLLPVAVLVLLLVIAYFGLRPLFSSDQPPVIEATNDAAVVDEPVVASQEKPTPPAQKQPSRPTGQEATQSATDGQDESEAAAEEVSEEPGIAVSTPDPTAPAFDEDAARRQIEGIVERQRAALEAGDVAGALADMSTEMRWEREKLLRNVFELYRDMQITIRDLQISFRDEEHAQLSFGTSFAAVRVKDGSREEMTARELWKLNRQSGQWRITDIRNEN